MTTQLIAMIPTAVIVDGVRTVIAPGELLPELGEHDARELLHSGAAANPADAAAEAAQEERSVAAAQADFEASRQAVQQAQASTGEPSAEPEADAPATPGHTATPAKTARK